MNSRYLKEISSDDLITQPIDYYKIKLEDFETGTLSRNIDISSNTYLSNEIINNVLYTNDNFDGKVTYLINCGVGTGKSTAIVNLSKLLSNEYVVVIVSPFMALINMYFDNLLRQVNDENEIFTQHEFNLVNKSDSKSYLKHRIEHSKIHITTVNLLLRNSGDL